MMKAKKVDGIQGGGNGTIVYHEFSEGNEMISAALILSVFHYKASTPNFQAKADSTN